MKIDDQECDRYNRKKQPGRSIRMKQSHSREHEEVKGNRPYKVPPMMVSDSVVRIPQIFKRRKTDYPQEIVNHLAAFGRRKESEIQQRCTWEQQESVNKVGRFVVQQQIRVKRPGQVLSTQEIVKQIAERDKKHNVVVFIPLLIGS